MNLRAITSRSFASPICAIIALVVTMNVPALTSASSIWVQTVSGNWIQVPAVSAEECARPINPYTEPEKALACSKGKPTSPKQPPKVFALGAAYSTPYHHRILLVVGVVLGLDGDTIVVGQQVEPSEGRGDIITFTATSYEAQRWALYETER